MLEDVALGADAWVVISLLRDAAFVGLRERVVDFYDVGRTGQPLIALARGVPCAVAADYDVLPSNMKFAVKPD
jgi:hypothetical protein